MSYFKNLIKAKLEHDKKVLENIARAGLPRSIKSSAGRVTREIVRTLTVVLQEERCDLLEWTDLALAGQ